MNNPQHNSPSKINNLLTDYIIKRSKHAVLLTGTWGSGKTHYIKNDFLKTSNVIDYRHIVVSVFGCKTIDDVKNRIFLELFPTLDNKYLKLSNTVLKSVLKAVDITSIIVKTIEETSKELNDNKFAFLNLNKVIICIDDLERADPNLIPELLGFINSLVEERTKVIIIANEDKIPDKQYLEVKEKTIGNTIHFSQAYNDTFDKIIENEGFSDRFKNFLTKKKSVIHEHLLKEDPNNRSVNYRTLLYFLTNFAEIYDFLQSNLEDEDLIPLREQIEEDVLRFSLLICVEYKLGTISYLNNEGLDTVTQKQILRQIHTDKLDDDKTEVEKIVYKYYIDRDFKYYSSIHAYLTGGESLNKETFLFEIRNNYYLSNGFISEPYKVLHKLNTTYSCEHSDAEYKLLTRRLRNYAIQGEYEIWEYITLFYLIIRRGNVLRINSNLLAKQFAKAIISKKESHIYNASAENYHLNIDDSGTHWNELIKIKEAIQYVNSYALKREQKSWAKTFEESIKSNYSETHQELIDGLHNYPRRDFAAVNPKVFFNTFNRAENKQKRKMIDLIRAVYYYHHDNEEDNLSFFSKLNSLTAKKMSQNINNNSGELWSKFKREIEIQIKKIQN